MLGIDKGYPYLTCWISLGCITFDLIDWESCWFCLWKAIYGNPTKLTYHWRGRFYTSLQQISKFVTKPYHKVKVTGCNDISSRWKRAISVGLYCGYLEENVRTGLKYGKQCTYIALMPMVVTKPSGPQFKLRYHLTNIGNPIVEIRQS